MHLSFTFRNFHFLIPFCDARTLFITSFAKSSIQQPSTWQNQEKKILNMQPFTWQGINDPEMMSVFAWINPFQQWYIWVEKDNINPKQRNFYNFKRLNLEKKIKAASASMLEVAAFVVLIYLLLFHEQFLLFGAYI